MVFDTAYYDLLGIREDATVLEIKKGYRKQAVIHHPDKNLNDPDAPKRFQEIGEAYQVLIDPDLRKKYDKFGKERAKPEAGFDDALELFGKIFGGNAFFEWVGEISLFKDIIAIMEIKAREEQDETRNPHHPPPKPTQLFVTESADSPPESPRRPPQQGRTWTAASKNRGETQSERTKAFNARKKAELAKYEEERQQARKERVKMLSENLIHKIGELTDTNMDEGAIRAFQSKLQEEAEALKLESFGLHLLHTIGEVYQSKGHTFLDNSIPIIGSFGFCAMFNYVREKGQDISETWGTLSSAMGAQTAVNKMHKADEGGEEWTGAMRLEFEEFATGKILLACWRSTKLELRKVLREVCDKILNSDEDYELQKRRAEALVIAGDIFYNTSRDPGDEISDGMFEALVSKASDAKLPTIKTRTLQA